MISLRSTLLNILKTNAYLFFHTFGHPYTWSCDDSMCTGFESLVGKICVFVEDMREEGMKFGQFHFSKGLFSRCDGPIEMTYTCFPPSANDFTLLFFTEFG